MLFGSYKVVEKVLVCLYVYICLSGFSAQQFLCFSMQSPLQLKVWIWAPLKGIQRNSSHFRCNQTLTLPPSEDFHPDFHRQKCNLGAVAFSFLIFLLPSSSRRHSFGFTCTLFGTDVEKKTLRRRRRRIITVLGTIFLNKLAHKLLSLC